MSDQKSVHKSTNVSMMPRCGNSISFCMLFNKIRNFRESHNEVINSNQMDKRKFLEKLKTRVIQLRTDIQNTQEDKLLWNTNVESRNRWLRQYHTERTIAKLRDYHHLTQNLCSALRSNLSTTSKELRTILENVYNSDLSVARCKLSVSSCNELNLPYSNTAEYELVELFKRAAERLRGERRKISELTSKI